MIKLVILDIDGVLTDGKKYYGSDGMPFIKTYCDKDFTAIKRLRGAGVKVCFLSGDDFINKAMAKNRNIDFYSARGVDKADFVGEFMDTYGVSSSDMLYIGDDLFDQSIMKLVGHAYCPRDACADIQAVCGAENVLPVNGGQNAVMRLVEALLERGLVPDCTIEEIEELDKNEKFDITLYGNIIVDNVYCVENFIEGASNKTEKQYTTVGAIGNILNAFKELDNELRINVVGAVGNDYNGSFTKKWLSNFQKFNRSNLELNLTTTTAPTSTALIISDLSKNIRTSSVMWGACTKLTHAVDYNSKWCHFMYIDTLLNITHEQLKNISKDTIISVDFCLSEIKQNERERILELLPLVDFVLISDTEAKTLTQKEKVEDMAILLGAYSKKAAVVHSPRGSWVSNGRRVDTYSADYISDQGFNVLGAGDTFTASYIYKMLNENDIEEAVLFAHTHTTKTLISENNNE